MVLSAEEKARLRSDGGVSESEDIPMDPPRAVQSTRAGATWSTWTSPLVMDLLPELSAEETERLRLKGCLPEGDNIPWIPPYPVPCVWKSDASIISTVCDVLDHYNARHPGAEFDVVKPLMRESLNFRGQLWLHMNFWAHSRSSKKIKCFFAEVRNEPPPCQDPSYPEPCITVVESCSIIEEPLTQDRTSCAFCADYLDILHPMDDREFICGNGNPKDWMIQKCFGMRFISRRDPADPNSQEGELSTWTSPSVMDLLPDLSAEETERMRLKGCLPEGDMMQWTPSYSYPVPCMRRSDASIISTVCDVLDHYNARHPGGEFDVVKPLMRDSLQFRGQVWLHMNFWARSRSSSSKTIKRFFAEVRYKPSPCSDMSFPGQSITIVESCSIIEEPLTQYRRSCAFCSSYLDILHPMDDREFVCGNGNPKDWMIEKRFGIRFISRRDPAGPKSQDGEVF